MNWFKLGNNIDCKQYFNIYRFSDLCIFQSQIARGKDSFHSHFQVNKVKIQFPDV